MLTTWLHMPQQARPDIIYTSSKADATFMARLQQPADLADQAEQSEYDVRLKKNTLFHPRAALAGLQHLHLRGMPLGLSSSDRLHLLGSMINMASSQQLCALGALLAILHQDGLMTSGTAHARHPPHHACSGSVELLHHEIHLREVRFLRLAC